MYDIASCSSIGLRGLDLALCTKIQACIYINQLHFVQKSLYCSIYIYMKGLGWAYIDHTYIYIYIYIYGLYTPNPSLSYIYMGAIYMFAAFIWLLLCILLLHIYVWAYCKLSSYINNNDALGQVYMARDTNGPYIGACLFLIQHKKNILHSDLGSCPSPIVIYLNNKTI